MRVLLDECVPRRLKRELKGMEVRTVQEMGWAGKRNGELIQLAAGHFDVFLTVDRGLEYQQNLAMAPVGIVALVAPSNDIEDLRPLMPAVRRLLPDTGRGEFHRVSA